MQIVKECEPMYNGRLRYVSEKDTGIYNAMNKGIKMATGDAVGLLNSDDVFGDSMALKAISDAFEESNADCVFGKLYIVDQIDTSKVLRISNSGPYKDGAFFRGWHPAHPTFYVKTNCYRNLGYYNEELKIAADFELMLRFRKGKDFHKIHRQGFDIAKSGRGKHKIFRAYQKQFGNYSCV